jgi:hypothetical protein
VRVPQTEVPVEFRPRALPHLELIRETPMGPDAPSSLRKSARIYRPDVDRVAYWEFEVLLGEATPKAIASSAKTRHAGVCRVRRIALPGPTRREWIWVHHGLYGGARCPSPQGKIEPANQVLAEIPLIPGPETRFRPSGSARVRGGSVKAMLENLGVDAEGTADLPPEGDLRRWCLPVEEQGRIETRGR